MINVLLAEDSELIRKGIQTLLEKEKGIKVVGSAANSQDALQIIHQKEVNLLVIDVNMPYVDGYKLIEELQQTRPDIQIIIFSSLESEAHVSKAFQLGASGYLLKDISADELIFALRFVSQGNKYLSAALSFEIFEKHQH